MMTNRMGRKMSGIAERTEMREVRAISIEDDARGGARVGLHTDARLHERIASIALKIFFGILIAVGFSLAMVGAAKTIKQPGAEAGVSYTVAGCLLASAGIGFMYASCYRTERQLREEELLMS